MSGLPRSGNTLLSSLLSQNKKIKVSGYSVVCDIISNIDEIKTYDKYKNIPDEKSLDNVITSVLDNYYKDWDCEYIIDRGNWGTPKNLHLLKRYFKDDIKIISPVRDFLEVMSSMLKKYNHVLNKDILHQSERLHSYYIDEIEYKCDLLMHFDGIMEASLLSVKNLCSEENRKYAKFIEYNDLVDNPQEQLNSIYDFLGIERYTNHQFENISQFYQNSIAYNDHYKSVPDLHVLKNTIQKSDTSIDILSDRAKLKYSDFNFWRK